MRHVTGPKQGTRKKSEREENNCLELHKVEQVVAHPVKVLSTPLPVDQCTLETCPLVVTLSMMINNTFVCRQNAASDLRRKTPCRNAVRRASQRGVCCAFPFPYSPFLLARTHARMHAMKIRCSYHDVANQRLSLLINTPVTDTKLRLRWLRSAHPRFDTVLPRTFFPPTNRMAHRGLGAPSSSPSSLAVGSRVAPRDKRDADWVLMSQWAMMAMA